MAYQLSSGSGGEPAEAFQDRRLVGSVFCILKGAGTMYFAFLKGAGILYFEVLEGSLFCIFE